MSIDDRASDAWCAKDCAGMVAAYPEWCVFIGSTLAEVEAPGDAQPTSDTIPAGGIVGAGVGLAALAGFVVVMKRRRRERLELKERSGISGDVIETTGSRYCTF